MAVQIAHHFYQARDHKRAFQYYTMAGERDARLDENGEAIKHYTVALNVAEMVTPDPLVLAKLLRGRGLAYGRLGEFIQAI